MVGRKKINMLKRVEKHCKNIAKALNISYIDCWPIMLEYKDENKLGYAGLFDIGDEFITINFSLEEIHHHLLKEHVEFVRQELDNLSKKAYNYTEPQ